MKLELLNVSQISDRKEQRYHILKANLELTRYQNLVILSSHDDCKLILLKLLAGIEHPTSGKIKRKGTFTNAIGEAEFFHRELTGEENIRFICKVYGQNVRKVLQDTIEFSELDGELKDKVKNYSAKLRRKIGITTSLMMSSDLYQLKGKLTHPDKKFNSRVANKIKELAKNETVIAIDNTEFANNYADGSIFINHKGHLQLFDNVKTGLEALKKDNELNALQ